MEIYGSVSFQSSITTYRSVTFQLSVKSFTEAGELGPSERTLSSNYLY